MMTDELTTVYEELAVIVTDAVPNAQQLSKYGGVLFTLKPEEKEGQFCGIFQYASHVQLSFSQGVLLEQATGIKLEGSGKLRRHINIKSAADMDKKVLKTLLVKSTEL